MVRASLIVLPLAAAVAAASMATPACAADNEPVATPYRPSVAGGAFMSRPGWLELELGAQRLGGHDTDRRDSLPYLLKLALSEQWGLLLGGEAQIRQTPAGASGLSGVGDTTFTLKYRLPWDVEGTAFGAEAAVKLPTARLGLGSGERDYSLKGIYSQDLAGDFHLDLNLGGTRQGAVAAGQSRTQLAWAGAVSHPAGEAWSLVLDYSGTRQSGVPSTSQLLAGASFSASKRVVLDAGLARGLSRAAPQWTAFAGMTVLLGRLF